MQPMWPSMIGASRADRVHVVASVGEVGAVAAIHPATIDEQRLVATIQRRPLDRLLRDFGGHYTVWTCSEAVVASL